MAKIQRIAKFDKELEAELDNLIRQIKHKNDIPKQVKFFEIAEDKKTFIDNLEDGQIGFNLFSGSETLVIRKDDKIFKVSLTEL